MTKRGDDHGALRRGAAPDPGAADARKLLHELQVHRIELELQNAELSTAWHEVEAARVRYADLYDFAPVGYFSLIDGDKIGAVNLAGAALLGLTRSQLIGRRFGAFVADASQSAFAAMLATAYAGDDAAGCEAALRLADQRPCCARVEALVDAERQSCRVVVVDITQQKAIEQERLDHARQIEDLSRRLVTVQESERRGLAAELHDRTSPNLAAINLGLRTLAGHLAAAEAPVALLLEDLDALLRDTDTGVREICADLRPPALDYAGLLPALESYGSLFARRTGVAVRVSGTAAAPRPVAAVESVLFRIAQEALTNCAKHARARTIEVTLTMAERLVVLDIVDDGVGFDTAAVGGACCGQGLLIMRERAEFAGGEWRIESQPGHGTRITVRIGTAAPAAKVA